MQRVNRFTIEPAPAGAARGRCLPSMCHRLHSFFVLYDQYWLALAVLLIWCFVFQEYFLFARIFLFDKYAADTITQFYPIEYFRVNNLLSFHVPFWSFQFGLGESVYNFISGTNPFDLVYLFFGKSSFSEATAFIILLKFLTAALFFHAFLKKIGILPSLSFIGSICYTFSGYMILNSHWYHYPNNAVYSAIFLYFFELWYQNKKWIPIVIVIGLLPLKGILQILHLGFFGFFYIFYRCANDIGINKKLIKVYIRIFYLYLLGIIIWSYFFIPEIYRFIVSARVKNSIADISSSSIMERIFHAFEIKELIIILSRFFSPDLLYSWLYYRGIRNYFEYSSMHIGILSFALFLVPFFWKEKKCKFLWIFPFITAVLVIFPYLRTILNAFVSGSFKYLSFYLGFYALFSSIIILQSFLNKDTEQRIIVNIKKICLFLYIIYTIFFLLILKYKNIAELTFNFYSLKISFIFISLFYLSIFFYKKKYNNYIVLFICLIITAEIVFSARTVTESIPGKFSPFFEKRNEYFFDKSTTDALLYIKESDNGFFRIEKDYPYDGLNDAIIQNYFGTKAYLGFPGNGVVEFFNNYGLPKSSGTYRYGLEGKRHLQNMLLVKYLLCKSPKGCENLDGFSLLHTVGDVKIYQNKQVDSFGKMFYHQITPTDFQQLDPADKASLSSYAVVNSEKKDNLAHASSGAAGKDVFQLDYWDEEHFSGNIIVQRPGILFFPVPHNPGWHVFVDGKPTHLLRLNFAFSGVELTTPGIYHVELRYKPPFMILGIAMSCVGILLTFFLWRRYPKFPAY